MKTLLAACLVSAPLGMSAQADISFDFSNPKIDTPSLSFAPAGRYGFSAKPAFALSDPHDLTTQLGPGMESAKRVPKLISRMPIISPSTLVDYRLIVRAPDSSIDYKMRVETPNIEAK